MKNHIISDKFVCKIGTSAVENWKMLEDCKINHLFFHLSSFPSCFVILEWDASSIPTDDIIYEAARQCKEHTKYRNLKNIKVDYTNSCNVVKGEEVGEVYYKSNRQVKQIIV